MLNIDLAYAVPDGDNVRDGGNTNVLVTLERDPEGRTEVGPTDALTYPKVKGGEWWLVVGGTKTNQLLTINRVTFQRKSKVSLDFDAASEARTET